MSHRIRVIVIGAIALVQAACADRPTRMYGGAERPPAEVAWIRGMLIVDSPLFTASSEQVRILKVDGRSVPSSVPVFGEAAAREVAVLPGKHTLMVMYQYLGLKGHGNIWLVAEAGKNYTVQAVRKGYSVLMAATDDATKKPVGGIVGSADEPKVPDGTMPPAAPLTAPAEQPAEPVAPPAEPTAPPPAQ